MNFHRANARGEPSPLVEAVTKHKGEWTVNDQAWGGATNNQDHEMWVPLNDDDCVVCGKPHGDMIRSHELMHAKISPDRFGPVKVQYGGDEITVSAALVEVAEEYRVNHSIARIEGHTLVETGWCEPSLEPSIFSQMDQGKFVEAIKLAVAGGPGADDFVVKHLGNYYGRLQGALRNKEISEPVKAQYAMKKKVVEALSEAIPAYMAAAERIMTTEGRTLPSWSQTEELAAFLEINLKDFNRQLADLLAEDPADLQILSKFMDEGYSDGDDPLPPLYPQKEVSKDGVKLTIGEPTQGSVEDVRWGEAEIVEAEMPLRLAAWKVQKANRAVEEGTIPRYMHRWPTDKRVFHRNKRLSGGTLLIDDSGSMGFTSEDLEAIMEAAPMATVAIYAGEGEVGEIRVVARDGKRARTEDLSIEDMGGNDIDGEALEWLGEQAYPRIWVTDGGVVDLTFGYAWQSVEACKRLCIKHKVTVVETAGEAAEVMKRRAFAR